MPEAVKEERYARLMQHQQAISAELLYGRVGKTIEVVVDEVDEGGGRPLTERRPRSDGNVYLTTNLALKPGDRLMVTVEDSSRV